jgi:hypothetical protein
MKQTSSAADLSIRLRQKLERERQEIESVTGGELRRLGENLRRIASEERRITEAASEEAVGRLRGMLLWSWLRPLVIGVVLSIGLCVGSWGAMQWLGWRIQNRIETKAALELEIERQRETVKRLKQSSWGIRLQETPRGRFVVLPPGTLDHPPWRVGGRPAVRLSTK